MTPTRFAGLVASLFLLSGCVSTSFRAARDAGTRTFPPVSPASVRLLDALPPSGSFTPLGEVEAYLSGFPSKETVLRKAGERAASVGADAIVRTSMMYSHNTLVTGPDQVVSVTFAAIRLHPDESSPQRP
jgi:hypothetical protein